jgi:hypothetical protein
MRVRKWLPILAVAGFVWASCDEQPVSPTGTTVSPASTPSFAIGDDTEGESVSGAVYTSTRNREIVNANQYDSKEEVYFNGGPSDPDNPKDAALLQPPDAESGDVWFWIYQVTDPSGAELLSEDPWYCRVVAVRNGRFYRVPSTSEVVTYFGLNASDVTVWYLGGSGGNKWQYTTVADGGDCAHDYGGPFSPGTDDENVSVQLFPYQDTPNGGGVYKAWATPGVDFQCLDYLPTIADFENMTVGNAGYPNGEDCATNHGIRNSQSKTDNYKVEGNRYPAEITVWKFHDANMNCVWDNDEGEVTGWQVDVTDPFGGNSTDFTRFTYIAGEAGTYSFVEEVQTGTAQTASRLDEDEVSCYPNEDPQVDVTVLAPASNQNHQEFRDVYFGNVGLGSIEACKYYANDDEDPIEGWLFTLTGTQADGTSVGPSDMYTGSDGCVTWTGLFPGDYNVAETLPDNYYAVDDITDQDVTVTSELDSGGETISGSDESVEFFNFCTTEVDFFTKGFWHNKNGLDLITDDMIDYVNSLDPYDSETTYFGAGDEPFDGYFTDLSCVEAAYNNEKITDGIAAGECTPRAEISHFLVDPVGDGGQCEQLAEQLLAFIFNVEYVMGGGGMIIVEGVPTDPYDMIDDAIAIWQAMDETDCSTEQALLEGFNSSDAVEVLSGEICEFSYPD